MVKISMIFPESFTPPADRCATAGSRPPPWILLDLDTYIADRQNATTATATSRLGHTIQVSLCAADPPAMSYLCVHCPCSKPDDPAFEYEPRVVGAEGRFALLWVRFAHAGHDDDEYFMYKADPDSTSLELLRRPASGHRLRFDQLAVVPLGDDGGHYLLVGRSIADLKPPFKYELHIYSSADQTWSMKPLPDACPAGHDILPDKVISLGDGVVGWVDLRVGVAVCDLLRQPLDVRFIPLPEPMPANERLKEEFRHPGDPAWRFRDVAFCNGLLKFVEVEHRWIVTTIGPAPEEPTDPSEKAVLLDSDLIMSRKRKAVDTKPKQVRKRDGWRMVTWSRPAMSSDCWHKRCIIDVDDIAVDDTITSSLRSAVVGDEHDESFKFRNMCSAFPTLSTDVDDLVYLMTMAKANDPKAWMVAVDLGKKTLLTALGAYAYDRHDPCTYNYRLCSLSNYLNMDPADSSETTKLKDSADLLKTRQSSAEEASCPYKDKPRDAVRRLMLGLKAQEDHRSIREHGAESNEECSSDSHGAESNEECSSDSSGPSSPPARRHRNCLPPPPVIKQSDGAGDRPSPADVMSPVNNVVTRPTGSSSLLPQVPVPPQQDFGQWSGAGTHPNAHAFNNHPNAHAFNHHPNAHAANHHLHDATGLSRSFRPPQPPVPQQNMSHYWNGVSYQNHHPWPPHQQYVAQAQQWNGVAGAGGYQEQHPYTHGVNQQNHWNAAAGYYYSPSANVNLQNQWGVGYGHYSAPNLPACGMHPAPAGQFPRQPGVLPEQTANQLQLRGASEQFPAGSGGDAAQAWTPRS